VPDLDFHIKFAATALRGDVTYNRSAILRYKEVCFRVDGGSVCTLTNNAGRYHYIKHRKKLRHTKPAHRKTSSGSLSIFLPMTLIR
jgi:hypothetical protein